MLNRQESSTKVHGNSEMKEIVIHIGMIESETGKEKEREKGTATEREIDTLSVIIGILEILEIAEMRESVNHTGTVHLLMTVLPERDEMTETGGLEKGTGNLID